MRWIAFVVMFLAARPLVMWLDHSAFKVLAAFRRWPLIAMVLIGCSQLGLFVWSAYVWRLVDASWPWWILAGWYLVQILFGLLSTFMGAMDLLTRPPPTG